MRLGLIGGTGAGAMAERLGGEVEKLHVATRAGDVPVTIVGLDGRDIVVLGRHGAAHATPPHAIDHHAHMDAMRACAVEGIIALHNTGALASHLGVADLLVPDELNGMLDPAPSRFGDHDVVHVDMQQPFCPQLRRALLNAAKAEAPSRRCHDGGTYVGVRGPRLETAAEGRFLATLGDVVGMTGTREAIAAREAGLGYASLAFVANAVSPGDALVADDLRHALVAARADVDAVLGAALALVPADYVSPVPNAEARGRFAADV